MPEHVGLSHGAADSKDDHQTLPKSSPSWSALSIPRSRHRTVVPNTSQAAARVRLQTRGW